jgi:FPC/CPF motif-containing protein YcgG
MGECVGLERGVTKTGNPFDTPDGLQWSNYCRPQNRRLVHPHGDTVPSTLTAYVHEHILAHMGNPLFTCLGAKSAMRRESYRFGLYPALGAAASTAGLAHDLFTFLQDTPEIDGRFSTYIASFEGPPTADERAFEQLLWDTLQGLHDADAQHHSWDRTVSDDVADPHFSFSFAGTAFFVIGLHSASSRVTRRVAWPTLVFNPHRQFESLKAEGRYGRFRELIRSAERTLQGSINPMLQDFGERSEAAQYSGRAVGKQWRCPFHKRQTAPPEEG